MKKKLCILSQAFVFLCILSCNIEQENNIAIETLLINPDKVEDKIDISFLVEDYFEIIPLETVNENLISRVRKFIHKYDRFFIIDDLSENLYIFNQEGKYICKVGERGGSPEEYYRLEDVYVENRKIYLLDHLGEILVYDLEGNFKERISFPTEFYSDEFLINENGIFFVSNYRSSLAGDYLFYHYNTQSNTLNKQCPFDKKIINLAWGLTKHIDECDNEILIIYAADDKIYELTDTILVPKYQIKFTSREVPQALKTKDNTSFLIECRKKEYLFGINTLTNLGKYLFAEYTDGNSERIAFINKELLSVSVCNWLVMGNLGELYGTNIFNNNDILFIVQDAPMFKDAWEGIYSKKSFKNEDDIKRFNDLSLQLVGDENPIVFKFKLKD